MDYGAGAAASTIAQTPALLGKRVVIMDLKSRPTLNGAIGDVLSFDDSAGRYRP